MPLADGAMGLERVVEYRLRAVLGLEDDVCGGERALEIAPRVVARLLEELPTRDRFVGVEERLERLPLDDDRLDRGARLLERVGGHRGEGGAGIARLLLQKLDLLVGEGRVHARQPERGPEIERARAFAVRAAKDGGVQHPRERHVRGVTRLAAGPLQPVLAHGRPADGVEGAGGPLVECVLLDDGPDLLVAAFDLLLGTDQSCHAWIASSMAG